MKQLIRCLTAVVWAALFCTLGQQIHAKELLVFISAFAAGEEGAIHAYSLDTNTGQLTAVHRTSDIEHPFFMAVSPDSRFLYSIHAPGTFGGEKDEQIAAFELVGHTGQLKPLNKQSARGTAACYLDVDATGKTVVVANYSSGSVASLPVRQDGSLGEVSSFRQHTGSSVNADRQQAPHAHCFVISPDNRFAYAADLGLDKVLAYRLDAKQATLSPNNQPFVRTPPGGGPRHLTFGPHGKHVYVINELTNSVSVFDYDAKSGILIEQQTISTLPDDFDGTSYCADLKITPNGRFLYGTNRGHDSIARYRIKDDGQLTLLSIDSSLGKGPQNLSVTPDGGLLVCANMAGDNVAVFRIDSVTGALKAVGPPIAMPRPSCIMIVGEFRPAAANADDVSAASAWGQWRGPLGTGVSAHGVPVQWDNEDVLWTTELQGRGQSSPVAWGDRIFLTTASKDGHDCAVVCIDAGSGEQLWRADVENETPEKIHGMNTWATPTCACDGQLVVASFGNAGLHCYDMDGNHRWSKDLGKFERSGWGSGSSPVMVDNLVIQACDADNVSFLVAINKADGQEIWRTTRPEMRSFSTPILIDAGGRRELVINGHSGMHAYDPSKGDLLWHCSGGSGRGTPTVVSGAGLVIAISGRRRGVGDMMAVRPGGSGDVTKTGLAWSVARGSGRDLPSPIVVGDYLLAVDLRPGLATCYEAARGYELWKKRLPGQYSASPIAAGGLVYALNESGETTVIKPGPRYQQIAANEFEVRDDEVFRASLMPYNGRIFCRSDKRLYCIGKTIHTNGNTR